MFEFCSYNIIVFMRFCDFFLYYSYFIGFFIFFGYWFFFGTVDKGNTFVKVEICFIFGSYFFDF